MHHIAIYCNMTMRRERAFAGLGAIRRSAISPRVAICAAYNPGMYGRTGNASSAAARGRKFTVLRRVFRWLLLQYVDIEMLRDVYRIINDHFYVDHHEIEIVTKLWEYRRNRAPVIPVIMARCEVRPSGTGTSFGRSPVPGAPCRDRD